MDTSTLVTLFSLVLSGILMILIYLFMIIKELKEIKYTLLTQGETILNCIRSHFKAQTRVINHLSQTKMDKNGSENTSNN